MIAPPSTPSGPSGISASTEPSDLAWLIDALDAVAGLGQTLNAGLGTVWTPGDVFEASKPALRRLADFSDMALLTVDEDGLGFDLVRAEPSDAVERIRQEIQHQSRQGTFSWALYQDRPVLVPGRHMGRWVLLHVLASPSRISGMFVASSRSENFFLPDLAQKILSILLQKCAGVMESGALYQELAEYNQNLEDVIERRTQELRKSEEAARSASRAKSDFLAKMSHEIRTPINGVLGTNSLLLETSLTREQRGYAETTGRSARNLLELVNDILDFSKIEAGQLTLEEVPFDLRGLAEEGAEFLAPSASGKGLELILHYCPGTCRHLKGDPARLRQIILNLLSNAVKFTQEGHVLLKVEGNPEGAGSGAVRISVEDSGIGIEPGNLKKIFETFEQADSTTTRRFGGTGLGLAITRELVDLMGGEIRVRSEPGVGSIFQVDLDLAVAEDRTDGLQRLRPKTGVGAFVLSPSTLLRRSLMEELEAWGLRPAGASSIPEAREILSGRGGVTTWPRILFVDSAAGTGPFEAFSRWVRRTRAGDPPHLVGLLRTGEESGALSEEGLYDLVLHKPLLERSVRRALRLLSEGHRGALGAGDVQGGTVARRLKGRVLLVEDDETNQVMAGAMLGKVGLTFKLAENGLRALQALDDDSFDLVLMDCLMPEMDGYQATAAIRNRGDARSHVPIVALTASALPEDRDRCLKAGMDDFITKPITLDDFRKALSRWLPQEEEPGPASSASDAFLEGEDFDLASALHRVGGSMDLLSEVGEIFFRGWNEREPILRQALQESDMGVLRDVAHKIKGAALNLSASTVAELAGELETRGLQLRLDGADAVLESLVLAVGDFRRAFEEDLATERVTT